MKLARGMKVLYHFTGGVQGEEMNFQDSVKKLKSIDFLIDLQISISKIVKTLVLTDDGKILSLDAPLAEAEAS